jgi:hypothetical protein
MVIFILHVVDFGSISKCRFVCLSLERIFVGYS